MVYPNDALQLPVSSTLLGSAYHVSSSKQSPLQMSFITKEKEGINLRNDSNSIVLIPKHSQLVDVTACYSINLSKNMDDIVRKIRKIYDVASKI